MLYRLIVVLVFGGMVGSCVQAADGANELLAQSPVFLSGSAKGAMPELSTFEAGGDVSANFLVDSDADNKEEDDRFKFLLHLARSRFDDKKVLSLFYDIYKDHQLSYGNKVEALGKNKLLNWVEENSNDVWNNALMVAIITGNTKSMQILSDIGIDVDNVYEDEGDFTPLMIAIQYREWEAVRFLLDKKVNLGRKNNEGETALTKAAEFGDEQIVRLLLDNGARETIDTQNNEGETALIRAIKSGKNEIVSLLIAAGADVNMQSKRYTPLTQAGFLAFRYGKGTVKELLGAGARIEGQDKYGITSLMYVGARFGGSAAIEELLDAGAKRGINMKNYVNMKNKDGGTALWYAVENYRKKNISLLLKAGADVNMLKDGETVLDHARAIDGVYFGYVNEIIELLKEHGALTAKELEADDYFESQDFC